MTIGLKPVEHLIFESPLVLLADYRCEPSDPLFADSGPANANVIAFPLTSTRIIRDDVVFIEHPGAASLFNAGVAYSQQPLGSEGAYCQWLTFADDLMFDLAGSTAPGEAPFRVPQVPLDAAVALRQRVLFRYAATFGQHDRLTVEEEAIGIGAAVLTNARSVGSKPPRAAPTAQKAMEWIASRFYADVSLSDVSADLGVSAPYLSRLFHESVGQTMHAFREELRLRRALDLLHEASGDLATLALDLGYSSHSHFTHRFRQKFGITPDEFVRMTPGSPRPQRRDRWSPRLLCS